MTVYANIPECPGHRAAVNMLTRDRLCAAIGIEPEEYIDTLGWAMDHPSEPVTSPPMKRRASKTWRPQSTCERFQSTPLATRPRQYSSASIIIAQDEG